MDNNQYNKLLDLILTVRDEQAHIKEELIRSSLVLKQNTIVLEEHTRRSTASEERIEALEDNKNRIDGFVKISLGLLGIAGTVFGIVEIIRNLLN